MIIYFSQVYGKSRQALSLVLKHGRPIINTEKLSFKKMRKGKTMIKIYGMPTCPYCDYVHEQIKGREDEFVYINIGENIRNMSEFTRLRDTNPVFDRMKAIGDVGIPAFVFEDGRVSIDPADAGLVELGTANACSIEDHKSGRKGC